MSYLLHLLLLNCYCGHFYCLNKKPVDLIESSYEKNNPILRTDLSDNTSRVFETNTNHRDIIRKGINNHYDNLVNRRFEYMKPENGINKNLVPSLLFDKINQKKASKRDTNDDGHMMIGTFQAIMRPMSLPAANYLGVVNESMNATEKA